MSRFLRKIGLILAGAFLLAASPKAPAYTITMLWVRASAITFESEFTNPIERTVRFDTNTCQLQIYLSNEWRALNFGTQEVYLGIVSNSAYRGDWGWAASSEAARVEAWFTVTSNQLREADGALSNDIVLLESDLNTVSNYAYPRDWGIAASNLADSALQPDDILTTSRYLSVTTVSNQDYVNFDSGPIFDVSNIIVHGWWSVQYFDFDATIVTNPDGVYFSNTLVRYQGDLYQAVSNIWSTNFYPWVGDAGTGQYVYPFPGQPGTGTQYWDLVVAKGEDGQSIQGPPGPPGQDGLGGFHFGPWHSTVYYEYNSETTTVVEYEQQWYRLIQSCSNVAPTSAEGTNYWTISIAKGADGELWGTNLIFRGEWDSGAQYYTNDAVSYAGNIYAITTNQEPQIGQNPPLYDSDGVGYDSAYWSVIVKRGKRGYKGEKGDPGTVVTSIVYYTFADYTNILNDPQPWRPIFVAVTSNSFRWSERTPVSTNWLTVTNGELLLNGESVQGVASFGTDSNTAYRGDWGNAVSNALDNRLVLGDIVSGDGSVQVMWSNSLCNLHVEGGGGVSGTNYWPLGGSNQTCYITAPADSTGDYCIVITRSNIVVGNKTVFLAPSYGGICETGGTLRVTDWVVVGAANTFTNFDKHADNPSIILLGTHNALTRGTGGVNPNKSHIFIGKGIHWGRTGGIGSYPSIVIGNGIYNNSYYGAGGWILFATDGGAINGSYPSKNIVFANGADGGHSFGINGAVETILMGRNPSASSSYSIGMGSHVRLDDASAREVIMLGYYAGYGSATNAQDRAIGIGSYAKARKYSVSLGYAGYAFETNTAIIKVGPGSATNLTPNSFAFATQSKIPFAIGLSPTGDYGYAAFLTTNGNYSFFWDADGDGTFEHKVGDLINPP